MRRIGSASAVARASVIRDDVSTIPLGRGCDSMKKFVTLAALSGFMMRACVPPCSTGWDKVSIRMPLRRCRFKLPLELER